MSFSIPLGILEIVIPLLATGSLMVAVIFFFYIFSRWRDRTYLSMGLFAFFALLFVCFEGLVILVGAYELDPRLGMQFHRLEQFAGNFFLGVAPFFIYTLLEMKPVTRRVTFGFVVVGTTAALLLLLLGLFVPDLFVSVSRHNANWLSVQGDYGRGHEGVLYRARDLLLGVVGLYCLGVILIEMVVRRQGRFLMPILIGLSLVIYGALDDVLYVHFGFHIDPVPNLQFSRFTVGITTFVLLSMARLAKDFFDTSMEVKRAYERLERSDERFAYIASAINEVFWLIDYPSMRLRYVNHAYEKVWGRPIPELYLDVNDWQGQVHPDDLEVVKERFENLSTDSEEILEYRLRANEPEDCGDAQTHWRWVQDRVKAITGEDGSITDIARVTIDITDRKRVESELSFLAYHDALTGLLNRKAFYERIEDSLAVAQRDGTRRALFYVDLDYFKEVNDTYGHHAGDEILKMIAARINGVLRKSDTLFRIGGDEFTILLNALGEDTDAAIVAEKVIERIARPLEVLDTTVSLGVSIGVAVYPRDGEEPTILAINADAALNEAKRDKNTFRFFSTSMQERATEKIRIISGLRRALDRHEFRLHYQPMVDATGRVIGAEALLRWMDPSEGIIPPDRFIKIAEESGLIIPIGEWVIERAVADCAEWSRKYPQNLFVSVNLSVKQLRDDALVEKITEVLERNGLMAESLHLEITESTFMDDLPGALRKLERLKALGVKFSMDDFGTGYSSLNYLKSLPVNTVKIDRSFVIDLPGNRRDVTLIKAIVTAAKGLGLELIAEGVESLKQVEFLRGLEFEGIQGFFYSKPLELNDFYDYIDMH
jgi:diguanylate cyclase (GGDEF)-like protein/PAS domain S-box-containing protein